MKFITKKENILPILQYAVNFTTSKHLSTVLQYVYIEAQENNVVIIKATDYQISYVAGFAAEVLVPGKTTAFASTFLNAVHEFKDGNIEFTFEGTQLRFKQGKSLFSMNTMEVDIFPAIVDVKPDYYFKIKGELFLNMLKQTSFCISTDPTRPVEYTGVHMSVFLDHIDFVATDQKRVAFTSTKLDGFTEEFIVNIPKKTVDNILKIFDNADVIEINTDKRHILFRSEKVEVTAKLIERYSNKITSIFQGSFLYSAKIPRMQLYETVKRVSVISNAETAAHEDISYNILLSFAGNTLKISSIENERGSGKDEIENIEYDGENMDILFNSRYILDILKNITTDMVKFNINTNVTPVIVLPYGEDTVKFQKGEAKYIITPRRQINTVNEV